ncbi:MAG: metallophosphoesterase [Dehalococcoidia bacterium]
MAFHRPNPLIAIALIGVLLGTSAVLSERPTLHATGSTETPPNFKVAFIGDQGLGPNAEAVLTLIQAEGADMVLHQGDLGYGSETNPQTAIDWDAQITDILGDDFPYFASAGNHDVGNWSTYQQLLDDRLALVPGATCTGDLGVSAACTYQGLFFILSGAGSIPDTPDYQPHIDFIHNALAENSSIWRICAWHKNQTAVQVGSKTNEVGWGPYEECRNGRAIIATAHEHSYERTKTLSNIQTQTVDSRWPNPADVHVAQGSTFVFVSGLGGKDIRNQDRCFPTTPPYGCNGEWASISTSDQGADFGALFIEFNVDGNPRKANGYFKEIDGDVIDAFTIYSEPTGVGGDAEPPAIDDTAARAADSSERQIGIIIGLLSAAAAGTIMFSGLAWYAWRRTR